VSSIFLEVPDGMAAKTKPPGRPSEFSREAAIAGAMNLFWRNGYLGVSTRDLAEAMNIQRSTFYNSFGDRESVFIDALQHYSEIAPDKMLDCIQPGEPVLPVLIAFFRRLCQSRVADEEARGCLVCNSVAELVGVDEKLGGILRTAIHERVQATEHILQQAIEQSELTLKTDVNAAARSLVAFLLGFNLLSKAIRNEEELRSTCRSFLLGLGVPEGMLTQAEHG
jgi:TetR/AcrR family transcriptional repressor of nem operon